MDKLSIAHAVIVTIFPMFFIFSPTLSKKIKSIHVRFLLTIIISWIFLNYWRHVVELPIALQNARARGDEMYDGVGGNAAMLILGWVGPLIFGLPSYIVKLIINKTRKSPNQRFDPIVKTPADKVEAQGTQGHP